MFKNLQHWINKPRPIVLTRKQINSIHPAMICNPEFRRRLNGGR